MTEREKQCGFCGATFPTLQEFMASKAKEPRRPFKPGWYYNETGQQIEAYWSNEMAYAETVNEYITIERSMKTKEIVGVKIHGVLVSAKGVIVRAKEYAKEACEASP